MRDSEKNTYWIIDRQLNPVQDAGVLVSRWLDTSRLIRFLKGPERNLFIWSPPRCGSTTFFNEVVLHCEQRELFDLHLFDARQIARYLKGKRPPTSDGAQPRDVTPDSNGVALTILVPPDGRKQVVIIDELEKIPKADDIESVLSYVAEQVPAPAKLLLEGDSRCYRAAVASGKFSELKQFQLTPLGDEAVMRLLQSPLARLGIEVSDEAAQMFMDEAAGNPYLMQRLAKDLAISRQESSDKRIGRPEMEAFLRLASDRLTDYFDDLVERILWDDKAPYAVIDLFWGTLKESSESLRGLGILPALPLVTLDGDETPSQDRHANVVASKLYERALKERCVPKKLAERFAGLGRWGQAVAFYELQLERFESDKEQETDVLRLLVTACFKADDPLKYTSFAKRLNRHQPSKVRNKAIRDLLIGRVGAMVAPSSKREHKLVFDTVLQAVDAICRTDRARLYLADADRQRLLCRAALGNHAEEYKKQSVALGSEVWKVERVFRQPSDAITQVRDASIDPECNRDIVRMTELNSIWFFPISAVSSLPGTLPQTKERIGVLCVDNPNHCSDPPGQEEIELAAELLAATADSLKTAKQEADRSDLQFRLKELSSLHEHLLKEQPASIVLADLFRVATDIQPEIAAIVVRLVTGYSKERLRYAGSWPKDRFERILKSESFEIINAFESLAGMADPSQPWLQIENVNESKEGDKNPKAREAVTRFLEAVRKSDPKFQLASLLSFRLGSESTFTGVCNFYTATSRPFLEAERELLAMIVKQAGVALFNAERISREKRHVKSLQILRECIEIINQRQGTPDDLIRKLTEELGKLFEIDSVTYAKVVKPGTSFRFEFTWAKGTVLDRSTDEMSIDRGITGWALRDNETKVVADWEPNWKHNVQRIEGVRTCAVVLMRKRDRTAVGALVFESKDVDAFTRDDIRLIETVVSEVPVAIEAAELVKQLSEVNKELEKKGWTEAMGHSVAATVHRVANIGGPIPTLATECLRVLNAIGQDQDPVASHLITIKSAANRMLEVARLLLKSDGSPSYSKNVSIRACIQSTIDDCKETKVPIQFQASDILVETDKEAVESILHCLVHNAIQACKANTTHPHPRVLVEITSFGSRFAIDVNDTGRGVPKSIENELFKTVIVNTSFRHGHGVGLFVSHRRAITLGGSVSLVSSSAAGSKFRLELPSVGTCSAKS